MGTCFDTATHECGGELASSTNWCREGASWMCCRYPAAVSEKPGNGNVNGNSAADQTTVSRASTNSPFIEVFGDYEAKMQASDPLCINARQCVTVRSACARTSPVVWWTPWASLASSCLCTINSGLP
jgi:hypothetical protein